MTSLWFARRLEEKGFYRYEVPMREFELGSCRKLCNALDMLRTTPNMKGGKTGALKLAHLAECHGMKAQVHGMERGQAHQGGTIPNNDCYEELVVSSQQTSSLRYGSHGSKIDGGILTIPQEPGLGALPDWALIEKTAIAIV